MVMANKDNIDKMKPKVASKWIREWIENLPGPVAYESEFFFSGSYP
jgi:hypothetical protein